MSGRSIWSLVLLSLAACTSPKAVFDDSGMGRTAPADILFQNKSTGATSYYWDFGDSSGSELITPAHRYLMSGRYTVQLKAVNGSKTSITKKEVIVQPPDKCLVVIHTSMGDLIAQLYSDTPLHQDNFIKLAEAGYYDGLLFHRVISGFMVQGGDPHSRDAAPGIELGKGGPEYTIRHEINDTLFHVKGALAAARLSDEANPEKASSGSQFYIVHGRPLTDTEIENSEFEKGISYDKRTKEILKTQGGAPTLDMEYTVFGQVVSGLDIIDSIAVSKTDHRNRPHEDIKILKITVIK